ncbi:hypothetical protein J6R97_07085 [bacterium]|nr:hypothetical protein [bacterium]
MTYQIPPNIPIGTRTYNIKTPEDLNKKEQKRLKRGLECLGFNYKISDPIEVKLIKALLNGEKIDIRIQKPKNNEILWNGNYGYIEEKSETSNYTETRSYMYKKDKNGNTHLIKSKVMYDYKTKYHNKKEYIDHNGDLKIDESIEELTNSTLNDTDFDGTPNTRISTFPDGSTDIQKYNKKYNIFK